MGNNLEKKFRLPRPKEIDFPSVNENHNINLQQINEKNKQKAEKELLAAKSIILLKSGNILVSLNEIDELRSTVLSHLCIYSIPKLNLVDKYTFNIEEEDGEEGDIISLDGAIQLKNGNILAICNKLYEFEGESIKDGPKRSSEEFLMTETYKKLIYFKDPFEPKKTIQKTRKIFNCSQIMEAVDGKVLYTQCSNQIRCIDSNTLDINFPTLLSFKEFWKCDIIFQSEFYPDYLYICKNLRTYEKECSELSVYDINDFCNNKINCLFTIKVSNSEIILAYCEYDKKYLLLDTLRKGIYILDMETKNKVAVCDLKEKIDGDYRDYGYEKMLKLESGHVIRMFKYLRLLDIREGKQVADFNIAAVKLYLVINQYIVIVFQGYIALIKIYD